MPKLAVDPTQLADVGSSIEGTASNLDTAVSAIEGVAAVDEPPQTAIALRSLTLRWGGGVARMQHDIQLLGRGVQAASTLYTHTDETAMEAG